MNDISENKILAIIPARGGSKSVLRKNIKPLAGKPLIVWTIETALQTPCLNRVIVSTDDEEAVEIACQYGAEAPFIRPAELAQDDTPDFPVYRHTLSWLAEYENYQPDIVVWLRPTAPLRTSEDIEKAVNILIESNADWVRSVCATKYHPYWMFHLEDDRLVSFVEGVEITRYFQRQLLPPAYRVNGAVDVSRRYTITEKKLLYSGDVRAYIMPEERSLDMDTELDFDIAELLLKRRMS